jgi:hypothetical protein
MIQIILQKLSSKDVYLKLTEHVYLNEGLLMIWEFVFSFAINISTVGPMPQKLRNLVIIKSTLKA